MKFLKILIWIFLLVQFSCIKSFIPVYKSPTTGYLVVEGIINSGIGPTQITLSRDAVLVDSILPKPELGAKVRVEDSIGNQTPLNENGNGIYSINQLNLNSNLKYRLHITTASGLNYTSDFQKPLKSSPIDSIGWFKDNLGVHITLYCHDPNGIIRYYHFSTSQTWEIRSVAKSYFKFIQDSCLIESRPLNEINDLYTCWHSENSSDVLIASTNQLVNPNSLNYPLYSIPLGSRTLSEGYSVLVNEYGMTADAYNFFNILKKTSEPGASLYSPLPSQISGNIHNTQDNSEEVIGYISVSDLYQKRIFISNQQVLPWPYNPSCDYNTLDIAKRTKNGVFVETNSLCPTSELLDGQFILSGNTATLVYYSADANCMDCEIFGSPIKPIFWPNDLGN